MLEKKRLLVITSIVILPFTFVLFQLFTNLLNPKLGYIIGFICYWMFLICSVWAVARKDREYIRNIFCNSTNRKYGPIIGMLAFIPVVAVFFVSFLPNFIKLSIPSLLLLVIMALLNGTLEEVYWRGLYAVEYKNDWFVGYFGSTIIFTLWHFSLWFAKGITYQGGIIALIGGALFMGLLWSGVSRWVENIRACMFAHIFVNLLAFTALLVQNGY